MAPMAVTIRELANRTSAVIDEVTRSGRPAIVTRRGHPVAAVVPLDERMIEDAATAQVLDMVGRRGALAHLLPRGRSAVEELLSERREEAIREDAG